MAKDRTTAIAQVAELMAELDLCMMTTRGADGALHARPMSNNGEVEFDGDVWFFSAADSTKVAEIQANDAVSLSYADLESFTFVSLSGRAQLVRDVQKKRALWQDELARWFPNGPEDESLLLIKVAATHASWWSGEGEGTASLA